MHGLTRNPHLPLQNANRAAEYKLMIRVEAKLEGLRYPPYFIRFVERAVGGGMAFLLHTLNPEQQRELLFFEKEFREGFRFEQMNDLAHAIAVYREILRRYPRFGFIIEKHLAFISGLRAQELDLGDGN